MFLKINISSKSRTGVAEKIASKEVTKKTMPGDVKIK